MAYREVLIQKMTLVSEGADFGWKEQYLSMLLGGVGNALCWKEDLWPQLQEVYDQGVPIILDICETGKKGLDGESVLHVEGIEDSGQTMMADEAPDDSFEEDEDGE